MLQRRPNNLVEAVAVGPNVVAESGVDEDVVVMTAVDEVVTRRDTVNVKMGMTNVSCNCI